MKRTALILVVVFIGAGLSGVIFWQSQRSAFPTDVKKQASFLIFYPRRGSEAEINRQSIAYDSSAKVVSYSLIFVGNQLIVNQQATPETFVDIPDYYPNLLEKLNKTSTLPTELGDVHLTRPTELKGKQSAVVNHKGTLVFVQPDKDIDEDGWRRFFNSLDAVK